MESIDESIENSQEKVEPIHLFENSWFFNNLFKRTPTPPPPPPIIPRCYSDPCPSFSNHHHHHHHPQPEISPLPVDKSMEEAFLAIKKLPTTEPGGRFSRPAGLTRAPSLPEESAPQRIRKSNLQRTFSPNNNNNNNNIARAPSLPASMMIRDEIQDDESDFSMSRLIRQASLHHQSDLLPPRSSSSSKGVVATRSPSTPKQRQRTKPADIENSNSSTTKSSSSGSGGVSSHSVGGGGGGVGGMRRQHQQHQYGNRTRLARSTSDMGFQELVGFRELNYVENKTKQEEEQQQQASSTKWHEQKSSTSPTTQQQRITEQWDDTADKRRSVEDDMKAQIKFWARTVASNVK